ncbi:GNAT family N-acetyltransferase [Clostridium hydrogeniformans]|uniref:GNAT family N-acetyltransferase n=1 Tax=Clostridium hydrogeniformans TaxID=349933 RepID=UPI00048915F0|nr:GNAT family N-acetyltransferase [Clostridium hydrogeniformans]
MVNSKVINVDRNNIEEVSKVLAEGFFYDDLYKMIIPDEEKRKKLLPIYFMAYVRTFYDISKVIATSENYEGVALIYNSESIKRGFSFLGFMNFCFMNIRMLKYISFREYKDIMGKIKEAEEAVTGYKREDNHMHLELLVVGEKYRGKGYGRRLMEHIIEVIEKENRVCVLETNNEDNISMYEKFGFTLVNKTSLKDGTNHYSMEYNGKI